MKEPSETTRTEDQRNKSWGGETLEGGNDSSESDDDEEPYVTMKLPGKGLDEEHEHYIEIKEDEDVENTCHIYDTVKLPVQVTFKVWLDNGIPFAARVDKIILCIAEQRRNMVCKG